MKRKTEAVFALFFISGFAGLIYESVWSHYAKLFLGHAAYAQTLVLVVFIGGLAIGAWLCARVAQRLRNPLRLYAYVEFSIGAMALVFHSVFVAAIDWSLTSLLPAACDQASTTCPAQWLVAAVLLAPQSILLGATFPLVSSAVLRFLSGQPGHDISALYFLNSLGAALGVIASAFLLIPSVGLPGTLATAGWINIAIAAAAFLLSRAPPPPLRVDPVLDTTANARSDDRRLVKALLATAFLTGLSSFIYEIVWIRMLSLVLGASTHSFELMLASFILGLALGGYWIRKRVDHLVDPVRFLAKVQLVMGVSAAATLPLYLGSFDFMAWLLAAVSRNNGGFVIFNLSSSLIALLVMLPATFCAGMTLPLITYRLLRSRQGERALGMVYAVNTFGSIAGVVIAVHVLMEGLGLRGALLVGALIDVALGIYLLASRAPAASLREALRPAHTAALVSLGALALVALAFDLDPRRSSSGVFRTGAARISPKVHVAFNRDGKTATVSVLEEDRVLGIRTNGKPDASLSLDASAEPTGDEFTMTLLGLLPMGHQPHAKSAAVIGFGSGMSTSILLAAPELERVDTVEIEPQMVQGAQFFRPVVEAAFADPRSHIVIDDAKSYFARGRNRYDIIVSEPSNPWVSGVASLFTEEFYARLAGHLNEGGVLSQWLHTYEMDAPTLASILGAVSKTFPEFVVYTSIDSDIVLIARKGGGVGTFDPQVLQHPGLQPMLKKLKITEPQVIQRRAVASSALLKPMFASFGVRANSDYYPVVDQLASKTRFTQARVNELIDLEASAVPLREMLDQAQAPSKTRSEVIPATYLDVAIGHAWIVRDTIVGGDVQRAHDPIFSQLQLAAKLVAQWTSACPADLSFEQVMPSLVMVAEATVPHLDPETATGLWRSIAQSRCARGLTADQRRWLELFLAAARRDPDAMIDLGTRALEDKRLWRNPASEFAFFAAATAMVCRGKAQEARDLINSSGQWVRAGVRGTEMRALVNSPTSAGGCGAGKR